MILGLKKGKISAITPGKGFWLPIGVAKGITIHCLYVKGQEKQVGLRPKYQVFLTRTVTMVGSVILSDQSYDGVRKVDCEQFIEDCEVSLI
jgi:hypothetical protein